VRAETGDAEPDITESDITESDITESDITESDITEPDVPDEIVDEGEPEPALPSGAEPDPDRSEDLVEVAAEHEGSGEPEASGELEGELEGGSEYENDIDTDGPPPARDAPQELARPDPAGTAVEVAADVEVAAGIAVSPSAGTPPADGLTPRKRLLVAMRPRATRAQLLAMALCFVLGLAGFIAVRQNQSLGLDSMRQSDLVSLLDNVTERSARVEDETRRLQAMASQLRSGSDRSTAALEAAQQRLEQLGILAGTSPAVGPGIQLTITDPLHKVSAATVLDAVEELRDAGAEAIQIGEVRAVASTAFVNSDRGVRVDGVEVPRPYVLLVIGDSQTLASALGIPGGVLEVLKQNGATGTVETRQTVTVSAVRPVDAPKYAHPATSEAP
jgi:uncharacterized protein YlxW (UPF0749 family)